MTKKSCSQSYDAEPRFEYTIERILLSKRRECGISNTENIENWILSQRNVAKCSTNDPTRSIKSLASSLSYLLERRPNLQCMIGFLVA